MLKRYLKIKKIRHQYTVVTVQYMEDNNSEEKRPFAGCHWHGKGGGNESALFAKSVVSSIN